MEDAHRQDRPRGRGARKSGSDLVRSGGLSFLPEFRQGCEAVDKSVATLLDQWDIRKPTGPCHHGIGSLFLQVEFPFFRYNLFFYVFVLSFFDRTKGDPRFRAALNVLESKLSPDGQIVDETPHRGLKGLKLCEKGRPSRPATARYDEIRGDVNLAQRG